ncbi:unnamed protein product, partial [Rotaria sp. Silwood2]
DNPGVVFYYDSLSEEESVFQFYEEFTNDITEQADTDDEEN